jgi:tRNA-specific 2-thiouridylase
MKKTQKTVLLALSGGVDSSVSALLLKKQGYNVIGLFMRTLREYSTTNKACSSKQFTDEKFAKIISKMLRIKLIILDEIKPYKNKVINPMIQAYQKGLTPNPDITCNKLIKFPVLMKEAKKIKADYIVTGHYARIARKNEEYHLLQGTDKTKDQSYFLYELTQKELSKLIFPIGNLTKEEVRKIAEKNNLPNYNKPGTRGICFIGKMPSIKQFLENKIKKRKGKILSPEGKFLGTHEGTAFYTIGQKIQEHLGMRINKPKQFAQKRYYIAEKRKNNIIIAAPENHPSLLKRSVIINNLHIINPNQITPRSGLTARIRHLGQLHSGRLVNNNRFVFSKPIEGIAKGQSIVLYHKNQVLGGGIQSNPKP